MRAGVTVATPALDLWRAWADPEHIAQWFVDRAEGTCKPGEVMTWIFEAFSYRIPVPILEAEPGKRFVTGADAGVVGPLPKLLEVDIETVDGGSKLRLVDSGFSEDASADDEFEGVRSGWDMALHQLKWWLEHSTSGARNHMFAMRSTTATWEQLATRYSGATGLATFLDDVDAPAKLTVGDRVSAKLAGHPFTGRVLAHTGREFLLEWSELTGVVGFKAFTTGPTRSVAIDLSAWGSVPTLDFTRTLERLATS